MPQSCNNTKIKEIDFCIVKKVCSQKNKVKNITDTGGERLKKNLAKKYLEVIDSDLIYPKIRMLIPERSKLTPVKILLSNALTHLELLEDKEKNLFLSSVITRPEGVVYYATTPSLFCAFLEDAITLQTLFNESPSFFWGDQQ